MSIKKQIISRIGYHIARRINIARLMLEYRRETDPEEKENIQRVLKELRENEPLELPKR